MRKIARSVLFKYRKTPSPQVSAIRLPETVHRGCPDENTRQTTRQSYVLFYAVAAERHGKSVSPFPLFRSMPGWHNKDTPPSCFSSPTPERQRYCTFPLFRTNAGVAQQRHSPFPVFQVLRRNGKDTVPSRSSGQCRNDATKLPRFTAPRTTRQHSQPTEQKNHIIHTVHDCTFYKTDQTEVRSHGT